MMTRISRSLFLVVTLALAGGVASAQIMPGTPPYSTISGGPVDEINLANLNVHFKFPVFHKPGRGMPFNMDATYDTTIWYPAYSTSYGWYWQNVATTGWTESSLNVGSLYGSEVTISGVIYYCDFVYYDGYGTGHPFPGPVVDPYGDQCPANSTSTGPIVASAVDGSGYTLTLNNFSGTNFTVTLNSRDGNYIVPPVGTQTGPGHVVDRNGNEISFDGSSIYTDTLGQHAITVAITATSRTYTYTSPAGAQANVTMALKAYNTIETNFGCSNVLDIVGSGNLMDRMTLPNGTYYQFAYEPTPGGPAGAVTARLASITLPTGGTISYTYAGVNCADGTAVTMTRQTPDGTWSYARTQGSGAATTTTVTDPQGNQTVLQFQGIYETQRKVYQGSASSGTLLETTNTCYNGAASPCTGTAITLPIAQKTVIAQLGASGPQAKKAYTIANDGSGVILEEDDYDYGPTAPGPLLKKILYTYASLGPIKSFPKTITVKDALNNQIAMTTNNYDETIPGLVSTSGNVPIVPQHVSVTNPRGNLTSVQHWLNTTGGLVSSSTRYYDTGVPSTKTDPNHFGGTATTTYAYSSAFGYAYPTQITNALGQNTQNNYDINTGVLTWTKDPNDIANSRAGTTFTYDNMLRPTQTSYPDGGQTTMCYTDEGGTGCTQSAAPFKVVTTKKMTSSVNMVATGVTDSQGRVTQTQVNSDPAGVVYTDTTYDSLGRTHTVSNPYRSTSDPTYGITTSTFDALGRTTLITNPDSTTIQASYSGRATKVLDEGNGTNPVQRISQMDGLGRIASLCEASSATQLGSGGTPAACGQDIAATGFLTTYSYDALDNLTRVSQGGNLTRTFTYDSLSRLVCAASPEIQIATCPATSTGSYTTGTIGYGYDANSNLTSQTGPKPNQTSASVTVTTTSAYDVLNRLTSKTYSDGTSPVTYIYDQANAIWGATANAVGRLTSQGTQVGSTWTTASAFSYDPMGRPIADFQCGPHNCLSGNFPLSFTYDLMGDMVTASYGAVFTHSYDAGGHLTQLTSSLTGSGYLGTLFSGATYNALGGMTGWTFGNGWQETSTFTKRGLLQSRTDTKGTAYPQFTLGFAPNGNVLSANDKFNGNWTYTYDDFNRLAGANQNTGQTVYNYKYDRYSNRWQQNLTAGSGQTSNLSFSGNNNRIDGSSYDAAGNLLNDGRHSYTYDAENRITQVDAGTTASYVYNADGLRARKTVGTTSTDYLFDLGGWQIQQFDGATGANLGGEVYANGRHVAAYANSTMYFIHPDWLGTERARTDISAAIHDSCVNLAYGDGQTCTTVGGDPSPLHFTGEPRDSETSLDWMQARHYSSQYGRFMTPDPAGMGAADLTNPQSLNQYAYVGDNPTNATDPTGMGPCGDFVACDDGGLGGLGGGIGGGGLPGLGGGGIGGGGIGGVLGGLPGLGGGLPGIPMPGDGCDFGSCGSSGSGAGCDFGACGSSLQENPSEAIKIGSGICAIQPEICEVVVPALGAYLAYLAAKAAADLDAIRRPIIQSGKTNATPPNAPQPPQDPAQAPGAEWEWRGTGQPGSKQGSWYNPGTGEVLRPDMTHPGPIGPHWDYKDPNGKWWRIKPS